MNAVNDLVTDERRIGDNSSKAPLGELLVEETVELKRQVEKLLAGAKLAVVTDRESAKEATILVRMMTDHGAAIEKARVARKEPFLNDCRTVDQHFAALRGDLVGSDPKKLGGAALRVKGLVDSFQAEEERIVEAKQKRIEEEARRKAEEAAAAELARIAAEEREREASLEGDVRAALVHAQTRLDAELRSRRLAEEAYRLAEQAAQTHAAPIDTGLGIKAHRQGKYRAEITDLTLALRHARKIDESAIRDVVQQIYDRQVRAKVRSLPGANIVEDRQTVIRRA